MKYFILPGGVISGLGKGTTISSIGVLLKLAGFRVTSIKIDPYLNVDAGTMSPYEHGEVFVCDDGCEGDLDLGNYERFLDVKLGRDNNITTGKIYQSVIERERAGVYNGHTVQIVPHVTNCIIEWIERVADKDIDELGKADICLIEVGGTVGDIESAVFLEAIRQFIQSKPKEDTCLGFVSLVPMIGELKTKPTQHGVATLRNVGLFPDILCLRCPIELDEKTKSKISLFTNVATENCLSLHDCPILFGVPNMLNNQNAAQIILKKFGLEPRKEIDLKEWNKITSIIGDESLPEIRVAFVGKYTKLEDSYLSVRKALLHASFTIEHRLNIEFIESSDLEKPKEDDEEAKERYKEAWEILKTAHCLLVPGGFGERGIEGKIAAIKYARENKMPYLGICLGMQLAVIEYSRNILKKPKANSTEFDENTRDPVVIFMPEIDPTIIGGTMRLGGKDTTLLTKDCICYNVYHKPKNMIIRERHRHRYEVNLDYKEELESNGLRIVGMGDNNLRVEIIELDTKVHPFFVATQYHPEFTSHPLRPNPLFLGFIKAAAKMPLTDF